MEFRKPYPSPTTKGITFELPSRTVQSDREGTDLKILLEKYVETGEIPAVQLPVGEPLDGDFTGLPDFQEMQNMLIDIQEQFDALPSKVREKFANNPMAMVQFLQDEKNVEEAVKLGLIERREPDVKKPIEVVVVNSGDSGSSDGGDNA